MNALARKKRRTEKTGRNHTRIHRTRFGQGGATTGTHHVRTMHAKGKHGPGRSTGLLTQYAARGLGVIGHQGTRRDVQSSFAEAGHVVAYSGYSGQSDDSEKKGSSGLEPALKSLSSAEQRANIYDRLLKGTVELTGRSKVVIFIVGYAPTEPSGGV